jgi:uncharacterized protein
MRFATVLLIAATTLAINGAVPAQTPATPAPEAIAAAHDLMSVTKPEQQFRSILPALFQSFRTAIVQNRPDIEKQYDAMTPVFNQIAQQRLSELTDKIAIIYASNFTVGELHDIAAFYRSPTGQKFVTQQPVIAQQSLLVGQQFGQDVARDVQQQMSLHAN